MFFYGGIVVSVNSSDGTPSLTLLDGRKSPPQAVHCVSETELWDMIREVKENKPKPIQVEEGVEIPKFGTVLSYRERRKRMKQGTPTTREVRCASCRRTSVIPIEEKKCPHCLANDVHTLPPKMTSPVGPPGSRKKRGGKNIF